MARINNEFLENFLDAFAPRIRYTGSSAGNNSLFPVSIGYDENFIYIYAELPGVKKESIDIDFYNNDIKIKFEKQPKLNSETIILNEIINGVFSRNITLPICVTKKEAVKVKYEDGLLFIKINKYIEEENKFTIKI